MLIRIRNLFDPGSGIRDKHPGSAKLIKQNKIVLGKVCPVEFKRISCGYFSKRCKYVCRFGILTHLG
jgi:hypothetical protein